MKGVAFRKDYFLLVLILVNFFEPVFLQIPGRKILYLAIIVFFFISNLFSLKDDLFKPIIIFFSVCVLGSCFYSFFFNGQSLPSVIYASFDYWGLLFFFCIASSNMSAEQIKKILVILGVVWCVCYIIQWLISPHTFFINAKIDDEYGVTVKDDIFRMRLPCSALSFILLFWGMNEFILERKKKYFVYMCLSFLPIIIMGFRSQVVLVVISLFLIIPFVVHKFGKILNFSVAIGVVLAISVNIPVVSDKIDEMLVRVNDDQTFSNKEYIRYIEFDYFNNDVFIKKGEHFFGGGSPFKDKTPYARKVRKNAVQRYHLYWNDLGLVGLSYIIGIPAVLLLSFLILKAIYICKETDLQFVRFSFFCIFFCSILTSMELFRQGNFIVISIVLAYVYKYKKEQKLNENRNYYIS